jgi:hypothetical protein
LGKTLTELFDERFVDPVEEWARQHGTSFRAQLYGIPPAILSSYRSIDLPEGKGRIGKALHELAGARCQATFTGGR